MVVERGIPKCSLDYLWGTVGSHTVHGAGNHAPDVVVERSTAGCLVDSYGVYLGAMLLRWCIRGVQMDIQYTVYAGLVGTMPLRWWLGGVQLGVQKTINGGLLGTMLLRSWLSGLQLSLQQTIYHP